MFQMSPIPDGAGDHLAGDQTTTPVGRWFDPNWISAFLFVKLNI